MNNVFIFLLMFLGNIMYSYQGVFLKNIKVPFFYKMLILTFLGFCVGYLAVYYFNQKRLKEKKEVFNLSEIFNDNNRLTIGIFRFLYFIFQYLGLIILPVSVSIPIMSLNFIFTLVINRIVNNVKFNIGQVLSGIIASVGIVIIMFNKKDKINYMGVLFMILELFLHHLIKLFLKIV